MWRKVEPLLSYTYNIALSSATLARWFPYRS